MTILSDPYWHWHKDNGNKYHPTLNELTPFLIECKSKAIAKNLAKEHPTWLQGFTTDSVFQVVYFSYSQFKNAAILLTPYARRFECGAPFASTNDNDNKWNDLTQYIEISEAIKIPPKKSEIPLIGFIDFGCAFAHTQFRKITSNDKHLISTRLFALWDQSGVVNEMKQASGDFKPLEWHIPFSFKYGAEVRRELNFAGALFTRTLLSDPLKPKFDLTKFTSGNSLPLGDYIQQFVRDGEVDEALCYAKSGYRSVLTPFTHGTHVMDVAAGFPDPALALGVNDNEPPDNNIVFVQLPRFFKSATGKELQVSGLLRTYLLDAVRYILSCAESNVPVVINLSYGASAGPHNGDSILEQAIDEAIVNRRKAGGSTEVVIAAGNWRESSLHGGFALKAATQPQPFSVETLICYIPPDAPTTQFVEVWLDWPTNAAAKNVRIRVTPAGLAPLDTDWIICGTETTKVSFSNEAVATVIFLEKVAQSQRGRMALLGILPTAAAAGELVAPYGEWRIDIRNEEQTELSVNAWCERNDPVFGSGSAPRQAYFLNHVVKEGTLSSVSHGQHTIVVGGYYPSSSAAALLDAPDSSVGPGRWCGLSRNAGVKKVLKGPNLYAASGMDNAEAGVAGAAVTGSQKIRLSGTSIAAASATRFIARQQAKNFAAAAGTGKVAATSGSSSTPVAKKVATNSRRAGSSATPPHTDAATTTAVISKRPTKAAATIDVGKVQRLSKGDLT